MKEAEFFDAVDGDFFFDGADEEGDDPLFAFGDDEDAAGVGCSLGQPTVVSILGIGEEAVFGGVPVFVEGAGFGDHRKDGGDILRFGEANFHHVEIASI